MELDVGDLEADGILRHPRLRLDEAMQPLQHLGVHALGGLAHHEALDEKARLINLLRAIARELGGLRIHRAAEALRADDAGASALRNLDHSDGREHLHRPTHRLAADVEHLGEFALAGQFVADPQQPGLDHVGDPLGDLLAHGPLGQMLLEAGQILQHAATFPPSWRGAGVPASVAILTPQAAVSAS